MRGIVFAVLTIVLGALLGLGIEQAAGLLPAQIAQVFTRVFSHIGVHAFSINVSISGVIGLTVVYLVLVKFVKR